MKTICTFITFLLIASVATAATKPLKVFILVGQSNMEGHAKISTFDYIGDDPKTAPLLKEMLGPDGKPKVCDNVWISYLTGDAFGNKPNGEGAGKLTAGYGARNNPTEPGTEIGPEFTFGIFMNKMLNEPILLIKAAWGGKDLNNHFRPPSAGPYELCAHDLLKKAKFEKEGKAEAQLEWEKKKRAKTGKYYHYMVDHVNLVLKDIKRVYPDYDPKLGYEVAGFIWFQGFNDLVSGSVYTPPGAKEPDYVKYGEWLADLIRDVRKDIKAPKMPFVIGVMGIDGNNPSEGMKKFRTAMAAPSLLPEFKGNVTAVQTAPFWDEPLAVIEKKMGKVRSTRQSLNNKVKDGKMTKEAADAEVKKVEAEIISPAEAALWKRGASNGGYHYLGCAKTFALIGKAFAEASLEMIKSQAGR
ncbi:MAG: sialate O-acetylesterase [Verrucomicrobiaceae bacterium]